MTAILFLVYDHKPWSLVMGKCSKCSKQLISGDKHSCCFICRTCSIRSPCKTCKKWSLADFALFAQESNGEPASKRPRLDTPASKKTRSSRKSSSAATELIQALFSEPIHVKDLKKAQEATRTRQQLASCTEGAASTASPSPTDNPSYDANPRSGEKVSGDIGDLTSKLQQGLLETQNSPISVEKSEVLVQKPQQILQVDVYNEYAEDNVVQSLEKPSIVNIKQVSNASTTVSESARMKEAEKYLDDMDEEFRQ